MVTAYFRGYIDTMPRQYFREIKIALDLIRKTRLSKPGRKQRSGTWYQNNTGKPSPQQRKYNTICF